MKKLVIGIVMGCLLMTGCGSASDAPAAESRKAFASNDMVMAEEAAPAYDYAEEAMAEEVYMGEGDVAMDAGEAAGVTFAQDKKIIYQSNVVLETKNYKETYMQLVALIEKYNGYMEYENYDNQMRSYLNSSIREGNQVIATNNMTIRIPSANYSAFMKEGLSLGNVLSRNQTIEDRTSEYNTNKSYVDILNDEAEYLAKQLGVLENELKQAQANDKHYDEIIQNMKEIAERKAQVEKELVPYKSTMDEIDEKVEYSTITMELREVDEFTVVEEPDEEPTFGMQIAEKWNEAMDSLAKALKSTLLFLIGIIPAIVYILILAIVVLIVVLIVKKIRNVDAVKNFSDKRKEQKAQALKIKKEKEEARRAAVLKNNPLMKGKDAPKKDSNPTVDSNGEQK